MPITSPGLTLPYVVLRPVEGPFSHVRLDIGEGTVEDSGPVVGWELVDRLQRPSVTIYRGSETRSYAIPVIFDGFMEDRSVEPDIRALERLTHVVTAIGRPPRLKVSGHVRGLGVKWVITEVEHGDALTRRDGTRMRQFTVVTIRHYMEPELVIRSVGGRKKKRDRQAGKKGKGKVYVVKPGDTLSSIARRQLGSASRFKEIAELNDIRDPDRIRVGQRLRLPRREA